jgi:hypothetical protein
VTTWFEGVILGLETVGLRPAPRATLRKLGISTSGDWNTFNAMFKKSWGKKTPHTGQAKYKQDLLEAKLRHIERTP